jgi:hypothetical protein
MKLKGSCSCAEVTKHYMKAYDEVDEQIHAL